MRRTYRRFRAFDPVFNYVGVAALLLPVTGCLLATLAAVPSNPGALVPALASMVILVLGLRSLREGRVALGSDGLAFEGARPYGLPAFVPWSDVQHVRGLGAGTEWGDWGPVVVQLRDGGTHRVPRVYKPRAFSAEAEQALEAHRARAEVELPVALTRADADYRAGALTGELLVRVAAEPRIAPRLRIEAAERAREAGERAALAELAEEVAHPAVRRRLEKLAR